MFDWVFEGRMMVYVLLAAAALGLMYGWKRLRRQWLLLAGGAVIVFLGLYFLLDRFVETDREQVRRKLLEMGDAVKSGDADKVLVHFSPRFTVWGMNRNEFRSYVASKLKDRWVEELTVWDINFPKVGLWPLMAPFGLPSSPGRKARRLGTTPPFLVEAWFARDPDGQLRMTGFKVYNPYVDQNIPFDRPPIP